ncbi:hypothetical protein L596_024260 [Steinernema carpocapsae]|nr:hypothetical protein L596_024260 [Steinernema carpocapsae]
MTAHVGYPITVRKEDIMRDFREDFPVPPRRGFLYPRSTIGMFVRRLSLACHRQTQTEITNSHEAFKAWVSAAPADRSAANPEAAGQGAAPTARRTLFGGGLVEQDGDLGESMAMSIDSSSEDEVEVMRPAHVAGPSRMDSGSGPFGLTPRKTPNPFEKHSYLTPHMQNLNLKIVGSPLKRDLTTVESANLLSVAAGNPADPTVYPTSPYSKFNPPRHFEFLSSARIRDLILKELHCIQVAPQEAMGVEQLRGICTYIKDNYTDLPSVHLLEALNEIRCRRFNEAEACLRLYFDWNMIRQNDNAHAPAGKIAKMDIMPLRYAPLLTGRLCRIFGIIDRAQNLLFEAVQQAEADKDFLCMRLCLIEQAAIEMLSPQKPKGEYDEDDEEKRYRFAPVFVDGEFHRTTAATSARSTLSLLTFDDSGFVEFSGGRPEGTGGHVAHFPMSSGPSAANNLAPAGGNGQQGGNGGNQQQGPPPPPTIDQMDQRAFHMQLNHSLSLIKCIDCAKRCINFDLVNVCLERLFYADYGTGRETQARLISDSARSIVSTLQLGAGLTNAAAATAEHLLNLNQGDLLCSKFATEAQVIAGVNIAYSLASDGRYDAALDIVENLKRRFEDELNWSNAHHWKIAEVLIRFDRCFFKGSLREAQRLIRSMRNHCPEEADLKGAVLYAVGGDLRNAFDTIDRRYAIAKESSDFIFRIRCEMVRSQISLLIEEESVVAEAKLCEILKEVEEKKLYNLVAMVSRRLSYIYASSGEFEKATKCLRKAECSRIRTNTPTIERCLFQVAQAYLKLCQFKHNVESLSHDQKRRDAILIFDHISKARALCKKIDCMFLEKQVIEMAVELYGFLEGADGGKLNCVILYNELQRKCSADISWWLL